MRKVSKRVHVDESGATIISGVFEKADPIMLLVYRAADVMQRGYADWWRAEFGLSAPQARILYTLGVQGVLSAGEISKSTIMDKPATSRATKELIEAGLIKRETDAVDYRKAMFSLTVAGRALARSLVDGSRERRDAVHDALSPKEQGAIREMLTKLIKRADEVWSGREDDPEVDSRSAV